jgi:hypothetical protein
MAFSLSKALRVVCYLWVASALLCMTMPFIGVALHRSTSLIDPDALVALRVGVLVGIFAIAFYFLSRCKTAKQPKGHPVIGSILWAAVVVFGLAAIGFLYCALFA